MPDGRALSGVGRVLFSGTPRRGKSGRAGDRPEKGRWPSGPRPLRLTLSQKRYWPFCVVPFCMGCDEFMLLFERLVAEFGVEPVPVPTPSVAVLPGEP